MSILRKGLTYAQKALYISGLAWLYSRVNSEQGALILMYHSVSSSQDRNWIDPANDCPEAIFDKQMCYLKKHCHVISMDELCKRIEKKEPIKPRTVAITFDDGYLNNLTVAARILKKYELPATLYLATRYVDQQEPQWIDELYSMFKTSDVTNLVLPDLGFENADIRSNETRQTVHSQIAKLLLSLSYETRRRHLDNIKSQLKPSINTPRLTLCWDEVRQLQEKYPNITLGVHTKDHVDLTVCNPVEAENQITSSLKSFEQETGRPARHFSYPYGRSNTDVEAVVRSVEFKSAVVTEPAKQIANDSNRYSLSRLETPVDRLMFGFKLSGAYPGLSQLLFRRV
jgi:peptidoglycan/xylan/chitin deacetylase (PgdA/CDA1 family)